MKQPAVLLDKDGTLVENIPYNVDPATTHLARGAASALALLEAAGYQLVIVSNQSGVGRGMFSETALGALEARMRELFDRAGVTLRGFLYCPHHPDAVLPEYRVSCSCRKPSPGLIHRAANLFGLDLIESWMIGDTLDDMEAGRRAGCRTIMVNTGGETEWVRGPHRVAHFTVTDLAAAAQCVIARGRRRGAGRHSWVRRRSVAR